MACLKDLPVEVLEKVLGLLGDPVSVRRAGLVCQQWADIIHNLLLRGRITCNPQVGVHLSEIHSFHEFFYEGFEETDNNRKLQWGFHNHWGESTSCLQGGIFACSKSRKGLLFILETKPSLYIFLILGVPHPHGNHQSEVSQFSSQTSQRSSFKL